MKNVYIHSHLKKLDSLLLDFDLSFEDACFDHLSEHHLCREEVHLILVKLTGLASSWHNTNICHSPRPIPTLASSHWPP